MAKTAKKKTTGKRKKIEVNLDYYFIHPYEFLEGSLSNIIKKFEEVREKATKEHNLCDDLTLDIGYTYSYGEPERSIKAYSYRYETEEEKRKRQEKNEKAYATKKKRKAAREKAAKKKAMEEAQKFIADNIVSLGDSYLELAAKELARRRMRK